MYKNREIYANLKKHLSAKAYTIIIGARQTGKTTLLKKLQEETLNTTNKSYFISFENFEILNQINIHPENVFQYIKKPELEEKVFLFIDEIQYAKNPSNFLKYLYDTYNENLKIVASGSSAFYIDDKFNDSLAGRKRIFHLKHLNFSEFLEFKNELNLKNELIFLREDSQYKSLVYKYINLYFDEYLQFGGYPSVVLEKEIEEKKLILQDLKNSYIKKDIQESNITNESKFYSLMQILASQCGNLLNRNELAKSLSLDNKTIERYLFVLQKSFHVKLLKPFYSNIKKEIVKMPKVFFYDFGLRNSLLNNFASIHERTDKGELVENYAFIRLMEIYNEDSLKYWRTTNGQEIDFIATETYGKGKAYEVKFSGKAINPTKYKQFTENYSSFPLQYITYDFNIQENTIPILKL